MAFLRISDLKVFLEIPVLSKDQQCIPLIKGRIRIYGEIQDAVFAHGHETRERKVFF